MRLKNGSIHDRSPSFYIIFAFGTAGLSQCTTTESIGETQYQGVIPTTAYKIGSYKTIYHSF